MKQYIEYLLTEQKERIQRDYMEFMSNALSEMIFNKRVEPTPEFPVTFPWNNPFNAFSGAGGQDRDGNG